MLLKFLFRDRVFNRKLFALTLPISLQNLMLALVAAADALMLGKLNQDAMAAVSLATQISFVFYMMMNGFPFPSTGRSAHLHRSRQNR